MSFLLQVAGLWYSLAAAAGIGFIWMAFALLNPERRHDAANEWHNTFHKQNKTDTLEVEPELRDENGVVIEVSNASQKVFYFKLVEEESSKNNA